MALEGPREGCQVLLRQIRPSLALGQRRTCKYAVALRETSLRHLLFAAISMSGSLCEEVEYGCYVLDIFARTVRK